MREEVVETKPVTKYLRVTVRHQVVLLRTDPSDCKQGCRGVTGLSKLMANVRGPKSSKWCVFVTATQWLQGRTMERSTQKELETVNTGAEKGTKRIASTYHTVSEQTIPVIVEVIPVTLHSRS